MAELRKLWIVVDADESVLDYPEDHVLAHFCGALDEGGYSLDKFLRIYSGTGHSTWEKENTRVYDDEASARKDAEKRLSKLRSKSKKKTASTRLVERFKS